MERGFSSSRMSGVLLFDEDFDHPPTSMDPEVIEPVFTAAELLAAREEAANASRETALGEAGASAQAATSVALTEIANQMSIARSEAASIAEQSAEAVARLLLDCFATAFPALSARHGPEEVAAVIREILPALHREPKITVRVSPHIVEAMTKELDHLDSDLTSRVCLIPCDAMAPGDARITWTNGVAARDTASLWDQIEAILAQTGLLTIEQVVKDFERVE